MEQGAEEEINRIKETLPATSHGMEQIKKDFADWADKLQYAEQLLELNLLKFTTVDSEKHTLELAINLTWKMN